MKSSTKSALKSAALEPTQNESVQIITTKVAIRGSKPCNECGRESPYVVYFNEHRWGWRLCWEHMPNDARAKIREFYRMQVE